MKFVLATLGTRGDVEPCTTIGRELQRRGHDVRMAVPPNYVGFVESAGLTADPHGPDQVRQNADIARKYGETPNPVFMAWVIAEDLKRLWPQLGTALTSLAEGADLLLTDASQQGLAANVAEYHDIPQAALHIYPLGHDTGSQITKAAEDALRQTLGLPEETGPSARQPLEIQAYDELFFPGLAAEWAKWDVRRPFVGGLTLELSTDVDDEVSSWIAAGTPPIYFGFGSSARVASPTGLLKMISGACAQLGERALICSGVSDLADITQSDHVKVVSAVNHSAVFPACRAVVHHGGPGTTFAGIRAGKPTLALAVSVDQPMWAAAVGQLGVGIGRHFSATTPDSLLTDLRSILTPNCIARTLEVAAQMATPAESAAAAADLLEDAARQGLG
ncbi:glycosyltransferase [Mycobacterium sp. 852002-40037_SCH5390672]|uniref:glycosyltransferase n=1 Tax=Mycobacterium sp. 852002-40037_SCH5390672 TaxID=1834089 RepID=UPI0008058B84|nr:glycosyltransferase [Mycobacterium sp. 852002-40037_SCH5390672]OBB94655.1 glycosyltransferase [Mycobacterium sp. 852002-40037_SCH5390672]